MSRSHLFLYPFIVVPLSAAPPPDAVQEAATTREGPVTRPEQRLSEHDGSGIFAATMEVRGENVFFGKGKCSTCHIPSFYLDHLYHDLHLERFFSDPPDGPIKTFTLRGIKECPPYLHDGRCLTLEDTVEFFNLVLGTRLSAVEKADLVAFLQAL